MIDYKHDYIEVDQPATGHYIISGHNPRNVMGKEGMIVPPHATHISPEVPSDLLVKILEDRGEMRPADTADFDHALGQAEQKLEAAETEAATLREENEKLKAEVEKAHKKGGK